MYVCQLYFADSNLPPHTLESQKRDNNGFIAIQELFSIIFNFPKDVSFKSYGIICLLLAAPAFYHFFLHEICFYASLKPIATFSLHRQRARGIQHAIRWHRLVNDTDIWITNTNCPTY